MNYYTFIEDKYMIIGYIRYEESLQESYIGQERLLKSHKCEKIFYEMANANVNSKRPILNKLIRNLNRNDLLVISSLDRIGRSKEEIIKLTMQMDSLGVGFMSIQEKIDTTSPYGKTFVSTCFHLQGMKDKITDENKKISIYTLQKPRKKGISEGAKLKAQRAAELYRNPLLSVQDICQELSMTRATLYRYLRHENIKIGGRDDY